MFNRKAAENFIFTYIDKILPDGKNKALYQTKFKNMSDEDFTKWMENLRNGVEILSLIAPNGGKVKLDVERNLNIAKEIGHEFFQRYWSRTPDGKGWYLSNDKYLVIDCTIRRQAQILAKKISYAKDNKTIDDISGQPTGHSKGSKVSFPELQMLVANGLDNSLIEFFKYRGGDENGFIAMQTLISRTGGASLNALRPYAGTVKSKESLYSMLVSMHLNNTLMHKIVY